jgi:hypothetical protein
MESKGNTNYVDKKEFYDLIVARKILLKQAEAAEMPKPKINTDLAKMILAIATNLSYRYNFINYTYRDEMVGDAIETCIRYFDNFDPEKSKNPFAYFTQICYFAMIRRINKESKQQDVKKKWVEKLGVDLETYTSQLQDADKAFTNTSADFAQEHIV